MKQCEHCKKQKKADNCIQCAANSMRVILEIYNMLSKVSTPDLRDTIRNYIQREVPEIIVE